GEDGERGGERGPASGVDPALGGAVCPALVPGPPPFGHNGEFALAQVAAGCGGFEGNAQSLRLLTRLEAKVSGAGLNLTRATLDATLKYPWLATEAASHVAAPNNAEPLMSPGQQGFSVVPADELATTAQAKYGCYAEDAGVFAWIRDGAPEGRPCLEAQVMDWADDVAYSVHDLEDGLHSGLIGLERLRDPDEVSQVAILTQAQYCPPGTVTIDELCQVFSRL